MGATAVHTKELEEILTSWVKDKVSVTQIMESPLLETAMTYEDTFVLKKAVVGHLNAAGHLSQILLGCEFNQVRAITNIEEVESDIENHSYIINSTKGTNRVSVRLTNLTKGGNALG